jgi:hypothetical protein
LPESLSAGEHSAAGEAKILIHFSCRNAKKCEKQLIAARNKNNLKAASNRSFSLTSQNDANRSKRISTVKSGQSRPGYFHLKWTTDFSFRRDRTEQFRRPSKK